MINAVSVLRAAVVGVNGRSSCGRARKRPARTAPPSPPPRSGGMTAEQVRKFEAAEQEREDAAIAEFHEKYAGQAPAADQPAVATAQGIIAAGRKSRGEIVDKLPKPAGLVAQVIKAGELRRAGGHFAAPTGTAARIIAAGKKARGELAGEVPMPTDPTAAAIIATGRKVRGEF